MARLVELRDRFDLALGNDADADRHGIVTPGVGLMNPNHFLAAAIAYLFGGGRTWGAGRRRRQDARLVEHHRPRRRGPRAATRRGPGRLQVVRGRARRRHARLRRRGERRRVVPPPRRHDLDDRQGRDHRLPARRGADRADGPRPGGGVRGADRRASARPPTGASTRRRRRSRRRPWAGFRRRTSRPRRSPATRSPPILTTAPGNGALDRRAEGRDARRAGSRRGRRAPRTSTKLYAESFLGEEHLARVLEEAQAVVEAATA